MSKLSKLRGGNSAPVQIFSQTVDSSVSNVFARMQSNKSANFTERPKKKLFTPSRFKIHQISQAEQDAGITTRTKQIVVLDERFTFGMKEHSLKGPDGKWTTERCLSEWDSCPLCNQENVSVYDVALLTVLDLDPWTKTHEDGTTTEYKFTKRVLAVKKGDLAAFSGLLDVHGSFRGLVLNMTRGTAQKETASGKPTFVMVLSEDELIEEFGSEEVLSEKGNVIRPANDNTFPFNYDKFYPVPSRAELSRKYNIGPRPGSVEETPEEDDETIFVMDLGEELPDME